MEHGSNNEAKECDDMLHNEELVREIPNGCQGTQVYPWQRFEVSN
jgi:hypothetical protein